MFEGADCRGGNRLQPETDTQNGSIAVLLKDNPYENLIERFAVPDIFCADLVKVEKLGPCARLTFAVRQTSHTDGLEYQVVARLVVPGDMMVTWAVELAQRPDLRREARGTEPNDKLQ